MECKWRGRKYVLKICHHRLVSVTQKIREQTGQDRRNSRVMFGILNTSVYADCSTVADANTPPKIFNLFLHFQASISYGRFGFFFLVDIAPATRLRFAICPAY